MTMPDEFWIRKDGYGGHEFSADFDPCAFRYVNEEVEQQRDALAEALRALRDDGAWIGGEWVPSEGAQAMADAALAQYDENGDAIDD